MRFGMWNVRSLGFTNNSNQGISNMSDLMAVQEVRRDKGSMVRAGDYILSTEKETKVINWKQDFLYTTEQYHHLRD